MKIVFICSGIEPGSDGVGDYARELAVALCRLGYEVRLVGLAERLCSAAGEGTQSSGGVPIPVLRLPEVMSWPERIRQARTWLNGFEPDWVSLQFVIYGYARKGLSCRLPNRLGAVCDGWRVHMMMHETWIGVSCQESFKRRMIGRIQRYIVGRLVRRVRPTIIHTSIPLYKIMLQRADIPARLLSIPSAIAVNRTACVSFGAELQALGITPSNRRSWRILGAFGTFRPDCDYNSFFAAQLQVAAAEKKTLAFLLMGRSGMAAAAILADIASQSGGACLVHQFGARPPAMVSAFLQSLDFGVAATPSPYLGRSSALAAMRLHGLPILTMYAIHFPEYASELDNQPDASLLIRDPASFESAATARAMANDLGLPSAENGANDPTV